MKSTGKAAVVVPDNVLFEGGAGETVRQKLLDTIDLYTISEENPDGRWRKFIVGGKDDQILNCDKTSLDIFWIKDKSLADLENLSAPDKLAHDIIENLQSALESFQELQEQLRVSIPLKEVFSCHYKS